MPVTPEQLGTQGGCMTKKLVLFVLLITLAPFGHTQDQPKPSVKQCRHSLRAWVLMFRAADQDAACADGGSSPSCPFVPAVRGLDIVQLIHVPKYVGYSGPRNLDHPIS